MCNGSKAHIAGCSGAALSTSNTAPNVNPIRKYAKAIRIAQMLILGI
jgi:hypothetical protein